jgi:hypothetical protein
MAKILAGLFVISLWLGVSSAHAGPITIVDTGTPSGDFPAPFNDFEYYGAQFTIGSPYTIQSVEGYFSHDGAIAGLVDIAIHAGDIFANDDVLYHSIEEVAANSPLGWYGVSDVNWALPAGTYWVTFKPTPPWLGPGVHGNMPGKAPNVMGNYVFSFTRDSPQYVLCEQCQYYQWDFTYAHGDHPLLPAAGVRILAVPDATSTLALLVSVALIGIVVRLRTDGW